MGIYSVSLFCDMSRIGRLLRGLWYIYELQRSKEAVGAKINEDWKH